MWPWGWGQPVAEGNTSFSWAPLLGRISGASLHLRELSAAPGNFVPHGPVSCFSLLPLDPVISTGLGGGEVGKSEKQSGHCHLVTIYRYGGVFHAQLGGRQASEVLIRMRDESGSGLEAVQVTGQLWQQLPSAPSPIPALAPSPGTRSLPGSRLTSCSSKLTHFSLLGVGRASTVHGQG